MQKSESIGKLAEALSKAQKNMGKAVKDAENPFFHHKYADLASVWKACKDHLTDNGLAVVQTNDIIGTNETALDSVVVETTLLHSSGEWISGRLAIKPTKNDPQGIGSAITYARRYALAAMVGVCPEDDDGEGTVERKKTSAGKTSKKKATGKTTNFEFLSVMGDQKKRVGEEAYYKVLGAAGYEKADGIMNREDQKKVFAELIAL
jgi:hypothetical protein